MFRLIANIKNVCKKNKWKKKKKDIRTQWNLSQYSSILLQETALPV
jgi:hypothetical protein